MRPNPEYWMCIAGPTTHKELSNGADGPPRMAVRNTLNAMLPDAALIISSGWGISSKVRDLISIINVKHLSDDEVDKVFEFVRTLNDEVDEVIDFGRIVNDELNKIKMRTIKIKAIFKGLDNSCGYKTNSEYLLTMCHKTGMYIQIEDANGGGWCEYGSIVSFLENWDNVRRT